MLLAKGWKFLTDKKYRTMLLCGLGLTDRMPDEAYLKMVYKTKTDRELNLDDPVRFNEKLQWLKLNAREDRFTTMVDKADAKAYVEGKIGAGHTAKTLGVYDSFDEIDFDALPEQYVLKTTHGCGGMVIHRGGEIDKKNARKQLMKALRQKYFFYVREWPYKNVKPRILAEEYLQNGDEKNLTVYKIMCFEGIPKIIQVIQDDKTSKETIDYFDTDWNLLDLKQNFENSAVHLPKPKELDEMLSYARICSEGIHFLRTDWYVVNGKVYFSEFTFFSDGGVEPFHPDSWDTTLGEWIHLAD